MVKKNYMGCIISIILRPREHSSVDKNNALSYVGVGVWTPNTPLIATRLLDNNNKTSIVLPLVVNTIIIMKVYLNSWLAIFYDDVLVNYKDF